MYSNGRIYVDTNSTPNVGVSIGDLQQCFQTVIKATIGGQTVRRLSSDLGVIIAKRLNGDVSEKQFVVDGVTWQVESRQEINPWARYRPIPCQYNNGANNTPAPITPAQRMEERYGLDQQIDTFSADTIQSYEDYANSIEKRGAFYLKLRMFGDSHWKRLSDFAKTNADGTVTNLGYDHNAQPDNVKITIRNSGSAAANGVHYLAPLIPEHQRTLYIPANSTSARFQLPNDHTWLDFYYKEIWGQNVAGVKVDVDGNEEWLSPIDFMGTSTYEGKGYASVRRRIVVFKWVDSQWREEGDQYYNPSDAKWRLYNYATDTVGGNNSDRPYASNKNAWLDLTNASDSNNANCYYNNNYPFAPGDTHFFSVLEGRCLFLDCWVEGNSYQNLMPIVGYAYEVNINRSADVNVDVSGVMTFVRVAEDESSTYNYVLYIDYDPDKLNLNAGLSDAGAVVVPKLQEYYDSLSIQLGESNSINLLNTSLDYATDTDGEGDWFRIYCVVKENQSASLGTSAVVSAVRDGSSVTATKLLEIRRE